MQRPRGWTLFSLLLFASPSFGQQMGQSAIRHSLSGHVRAEGSGHIIDSARVDLQNTTGTPISYVYSDGNGEYAFDDIPGDCYVAVQHDGYFSAREFIHPDGAPHLYKDVYLRPQPPGSSSNSANPVSQHQLSIPGKARESFDKGIQLVVDKSDYKGAVVQFNRAIEKFPTYYEAYAAMALAQNKMGDATAAEASFRKSIELSAEKYPQAMVDLGSMLNAQKRFAEAEPLLRKVVDLDASQWRGQYELAVALSGENRFKDAVASAAAARDLKSDNPQIYLLLYNLHIQTDNYPAALQDADSYLKLAPDGAMASRVRKMQEGLQKALKTSAQSTAPPS